MCPHNTKKPSQAINNSNKEVLWLGRMCAGHGNLISRFVRGTAHVGRAVAARLVSQAAARRERDVRG